jgi:hypothetical protein
MAFVRFWVFRNNHPSDEGEKQAISSRTTVGA